MYVCFCILKIIFLALVFILILQYFKKVVWDTDIDTLAFRLELQYSAYDESVTYQNWSQLETLFNINVNIIWQTRF